jgi:arylsulfatase A-like enzyme
MPFIAGLAKESTVFSRAIAPSPWTLPSHVSILTGLEPWEHNVHSRGRLFLERSLPTLPRLLASRGYATLLLSGNALLSRETGFSVPFQTSATAAWWEPLIRHTSFTPTMMNGSSSSTDLIPTGSKMTERLSLELMLRFPIVVDTLNRVTSHLFDPEQSRPGVSPWIGNAFKSWLRSRPASTPTFAMINLIDGHDPYLTDPAEQGSLRARLRDLSVPQQKAAYLFSRTKATPERARILRKLYRNTLRGLDVRVQNIVQTLREANRWNNTLFVLTSDHGQALLEKGHLFHGLRVDEQLIRIPLVVHFPGGEYSGCGGTGWASLVDLAPTALSSPAAPSSPRFAGIDLRNLVDKPRPRPAVAISDGIVGGRAANRWIPKSAAARLHKILVAVYSGDMKVVLDQFDGSLSAFDVQADPEESTNLWPTKGSTLGAEETRARDVMQRIVCTVRTECSPEVLRRLGAWGYV